MAENMEKIRPALVALEVGDEITFHISRLKSVRTQASELGAIYNRQFKTWTDREKQSKDCQVSEIRQCRSGICQSEKGL